MKIAIVTPYGNYYSNDKLFDISRCQIGQNVLLPGIRLKQELEKQGHEYHTIDMFSDIDEIDVWVFQDINNSSILTTHSIRRLFKYILKRKWRRDYFYKYSKLANNSKSILIMQEPKTIYPESYELKHHKLFDRILTWDSKLVDNKKYLSFYYPQVKPDDIYHENFENKKYLTMICGNKKSLDIDELYSERLKAIEYFENNSIGFDLYGFGWSEKERKSYRGKVDDKLKTLSDYKFSICFENMRTENGYITEKIFDCFFAGCVPVYYGAEDIFDYVPKGTFIDYRDFKTFKDLDLYLKNMSEEEYEKIRKNIINYLNSDLYKSTFSIEAYVNRMFNAITKWD